MIYSELWEELVDNVPAVSLVVISLAPEASVNFIGSCLAAHAGRGISHLMREISRLHEDYSGPVVQGCIFTSCSKI
jgi:hypothetical protein